MGFTYSMSESSFSVYGLRYRLINADRKNVFQGKRKDRKMASVTFLEPSGSNLLSTQISRTGLTNLNVTRNSAPWINSNYPEAMGLDGGNMAFADNGHLSISRR